MPTAIFFNDKKDGIMFNYLTILNIKIKKLFMINKNMFLIFYLVDKDNSSIISYY